MLLSAHYVWILKAEFGVFKGVTLPTPFYPKREKQAKHPQILRARMTPVLYAKCNFTGLNRVWGEPTISFVCRLSEVTADVVTCLTGMYRVSIMHLAPPGTQGWANPKESLRHST